MSEEDESCGFEPLRLTIRGVAGSGKSTFIQTLVTAIRKMFKNPESVAVCGPTGSAAFSAGGTTCHHKFSLPLKSSLGEVGAATLKRIKEKLRYIVALIIDERSMISSGVLVMMEYRARLGAYKGQHSDQSWGGIPIVIMVGDDFQLPSVDPGAIHVYDHSTSKSDCTIAGEEIFLEFALNVMSLEGTK